MRLTATQLRKIIREELMRENDPVFNPGSDLVDDLVSSSNRERITKELMKTHEWFIDVVFPQIELGQWPITADDNYLVSPAYLAMTDPTYTLTDAATTAGIYIPRGATWRSPFLAQGVLKEPTRPDGNPTIRLKGSSHSLSDAYALLEKAVIQHRLDVPMQSFPVGL